MHAIGYEDLDCPLFLFSLVDDLRARSLASSRWAPCLPRTPRPFCSRTSETRPWGKFRVRFGPHLSVHTSEHGTAQRSQPRRVASTHIPPSVACFVTRFPPYCTVSTACCERYSTQPTGLFEDADVSIRSQVATSPVRSALRPALERGGGARRQASCTHEGRFCGSASPLGAW